MQSTHLKSSEVSQLVGRQSRLAEFAYQEASGCFCQRVIVTVFTVARSLEGMGSSELRLCFLLLQKQAANILGVDQAFFLSATLLATLDCESCAISCRAFSIASRVSCSSSSTSAAVLPLVEIGFRTEGDC